MRVFVTGASGFIGLPLVKELTTAGHTVLGLARSDAAAAEVAKAGAEVHRGSLEDTESLKTGAAACDGVIHLAFNHDFSKFAQNCEDERRALEALNGALIGTDKHLVVTSGLALKTPGRTATENDEAVDASELYPRSAEQTALALGKKNGVRTSVVRLPQVHDRKKAGLITYLVAAAKEKGLSAYIGDGNNRFSAAHVLDAAKLYRLVFESKSTRNKFHAVAEEGVPLKNIAELIGRRLNIPVVSKSAAEASTHFGWLAMFASLDLPASSALTQKELNWKPAGPDLMTDLEYLN